MRPYMRRPGPNRPKSSRTSGAEAPLLRLILMSQLKPRPTKPAATYRSHSNPQSLKQLANYRVIRTAGHPKNKKVAGDGLPATSTPLRFASLYRRKRQTGLRGERTAAAAASRGVGILKDESLAHQGLFVFEDSAGKIEQAL